MNIFSLTLLAQAAGESGGATPPVPNPLMQFVPFIFLIIIFYFLLIRPQQKRQKEHQKLIAGLKAGDRVITSAGIHGIIAHVKDSTVSVKVADNVKIEFDKNSITAVVKASSESSSS